MSGLPLHAIPGSPDKALLLLIHRTGQRPQLVLLPALRESGLLRTVPPELLQVFFCLLTFQEGNAGTIRASVEQISQALALHPEQALERLTELARYRFEGAVLLFETTLASGEPAWSVSKRLVVPVEVTEAREETPEPPIAVAPREVIIEHSRQRYGRPRAEVEAIVAEQLGIVPALPVPEGREGEAFKALLAVGVPEMDVRALLAEFELDEIEQQLEWLPERGARNPARFLAAAIRGRYESPDSPLPVQNPHNRWTRRGQKDQGGEV